METTDVKFRLDVFEGPLDLLLHLIKTNELEISEISISKITSQYLEYLRLMESLDLEVAGDYLVMAATLINIKLRALLPNAEEEVEDGGTEELDDFMSAKLLMQRLIEYRRFKEAAQQLGRHAERQSQIFMREVALPKLSEAEGDNEVQGDLDLLLRAFARVIRFIDRRDFHEVKPEEYQIEDKIAFLRRRLVTEDRINLTRLFEECRAKVEAVVLLLGVLELCRLKELRVAQGDCFDEVLLLSRRGADAGAEFLLAEQKREAEEAEREILANRTGIIDDGVIPEDEDAAMEEIAQDPAVAIAGANEEMIEEAIEEAIENESEEPREEPRGEPLPEARVIDISGAPDGDS